MNRNRSRRGAGRAPVWLAVLVFLSAQPPSTSSGQAQHENAAAPVPEAWLSEVTRRISEEQRLPQKVEGGFLLHAGETHARLDGRGVAVGDWRLEPLGEAASPEVEGNRVVYRRGGGITEWYQALPQGLEQGFTIEARPEDDLVLSAKVESPGRVDILDEGLAFGGLRYTGLHAEDAAGRPLHARMEWEEHQRTLSLRIDRKSTRLNSSHIQKSRMPSSA